ncbi:MAG: hypothetical protein OWQ50_04005 [Acidianus infernus]|uniref:hypothetical protein n=1 Tax=Acidianus infernus TaxID=12915 RepID=UPI0012DC1DB7|nr:hypothetical protein [Acidianus infernus]MCY0873794.1 hypothetical protein [Acidianus infernus]MCY0882963.1 hypothetical protein [Acidianus infernus]
MLKLVENISLDILNWYGDKLKGIIYEPNYNAILVILEDVDKISLFARGEIYNFFYNRLRKLDEFKKFVLENHKSPRLYGIILSPKELSYNIPKLIYIIHKGYILYDPKGLISNIRKANVKIVEDYDKKILDFGKVKKGEVIEI